MKRKSMFTTCFSRYLFSLFLISFMCSFAINAKVHILPVPVSMNEKSDVFVIDQKTKILYTDKDAEMKRVAEMLAETIKKQLGLDLKTEALRRQKPDNVIILSLDNKSTVDNDEAYNLSMDSKVVKLSAKAPQGIFYGIQTLRQLAISAEMPCVDIDDYPRFEWRGMHFDVCRYISSMDHLKHIIDEMAYYKLNKFHWHLTEDQGWRIEIKKYPRLAEVAAWRNGTQYGSNRSKDVDDVHYGGYYTQDQIKEIIAYAQDRFIEVIPEIEMPGHSVAAITAYNHLACNDKSFETGKPFEVRKTWGVSKDLLCAGQDETYQFLEDVLTEVAELFPSKYLHIGGDEAPHDVWTQCPKCQKRMKDNGLKSESELQSYLIRHIDKFLTSKGKRLIGWEEIMQGGLSENAVVMSWLGTASGVKAAQLGHEVIMCPYAFMYLDGYQASPDIEPQAIGYFVPLEKTYSFEPEHPDLTDAQRPFIKGVQGNVWTEFISNRQTYDYMVYPRLCAVSEIAWSPKESKNWANFKDRLISEMGRFERENIGYRIPTPEGPASVFLKDGETFELKNTWGIGDIRYTLDGKEPTTDSPLYTGPISPKPGMVVRSSVFLPNGRNSSVWNTVVKEKSIKQNRLQ